MRRPAERIKPRQAKVAAFPAPVSGWIRNENLATPNARRADGSKVQGASVLENYFPTATGVRMRGGSNIHNVLGDATQDVLSLFSYINGNNRTLFAATEDAIYDVTDGVTEFGFLIDETGDVITDHLGDELEIGVETAPASVSSLTGGDWSVVQFATSGGVFLRGVNGEDTPVVYNGTTWGTSPAITGSGLAPADLSFVWAYKQRLFFVEKDSLNAWYLPVDSIGGAATKLPFGGIFSLGGSLLYGATWSLDSGDSGGLSEQCVFISTEGEVAVFRGTDPSDASEWAKVGVYKIGRPKGPKAFIRAGGDLVIATDIGFIPLSQAIQRDYAALSPAAVSYPIEIAWNEAVAARPGNWHADIWPTKQMVLLALSGGESQQAQIFAANARTGAWGLFTGWRAKCMKTFGERFFFGSTNGLIIEAEVSGADQERPYSAACVPLFDPLKTPASLKTGSQTRITYQSSREMGALLSLQHDYVVSLPAAPDDVSQASGSLWGSAVWGVSTWGGTAERRTFSEWQSTPGSGYTLAPAVQMTSGNTAPPDAEIVSMELTYDVGEVGS